MDIHKAHTDPETRVIKSLCEPGYFQVAEEWSNVTCTRCLAHMPIEELDQTAEERMVLLIGLMHAEMGRMPTDQEVVSMIMGTEEERRQILRRARAEHTG